MKYLRIITMIAGQPWAIDPAKGEAVALFLVQAAAGIGDPEAKRLTPRQTASVADSPGALAVVQVHGVLSQRIGMLENMSGGTSTDSITSQMRDAAANPDIKAILMHVDSPGGSVYGLREASAAINAAKEHKPVIAQVDSSAASAAYWLASQATEVVVAPGGDVGSIGVVAMHKNIKAMAEAEGVEHTLIYAGKHKADGNPFEPLSEDAREEIQERVDLAFADFLTAVAAGRGKDVSTVRDTFGQGRMVNAPAALKLGMIDRIATFTETIERFSQKPPPDNSSRRARLAVARKY